MASKSGPKHFFVSYAHADKISVERFVFALKKKQFSIWVDTEGLEPGTINWELEIRKAISEACAVIFIASPDAARSSYVKAELDLAQAQKCPIYPVWLRGENWIDCVPLHMASAQYVDFRAHEDIYEFERLLEDLIHFLNPKQPIMQSLSSLSYVPKIEPLPADAEEIVKHLSCVSAIQVKKHLRQNKQTSQVVLVDVTSSAQSSSIALEGPHYLKIHADDDEIDSIKQAMSLADSVIGKKIPLIVDYVAHGGRLAVLYKPALGTIRPQNIASMAILLKENFELARDNIIGISNLLFDWNQEFVVQEFQPFDLLRELLQPKRYAGNSSVQKRVWQSFNVTDYHHRLLFGGELLVPNPLAFLTTLDLWQDQASQSISTPIGHVHGDLHADNLICYRTRELSGGEIRPDILDFATYRAHHPIFFDFAYLEFDLITRICPPTIKDNRWEQLSLLHFLSEASFKLEESPSGSSQVSNIVQALRPLRQAAAKTYLLPQHKTRKQDFETAYWLSAVAAGLNFARKRTPSVSPYLNFLGLMYAGVALKHVLDSQMILYRSENVGSHKWIEPEDWELT